MFSSIPVDLINALENVHSDSIIKAYFYCIVLTSVTQRGSKIELMWLQEQGGSDLFCYVRLFGGYENLLKKWKDGKWSFKENLLSIMHLGGWGSDWQSPGDAPISNSRDKVSEEKDCIR